MAGRFFMWMSFLNRREERVKGMENQAYSKGLGSFKRTTRRSTRRSDPSALWAVVRGVLVAAAITIIGVAIFALLLNWWNASDRTVTAVNQVVKFVSILAGVTTAMRAGESGGALRGACVGVLYMALGIACYALMMGQSPQWTAYLADLGMGVAAGGLFGMILTTRKNGYAVPLDYDIRGCQANNDIAPYRVDTRNNKNRVYAIGGILCIRGRLNRKRK